MNLTGEPASHTGTQSNPFSNDLARANSSYTVYDGKGLVRPPGDDRPVPPVAEFVHDAFRALVLNPRFACVGAKSAVNCEGYRFGLYGEIGSDGATAGLAHDLFQFVGEQPALNSEFTTYVAGFESPVAADERVFEQQLWAQLQRLHDLDHHVHAWDPSVSADPAAPDFSFSFASCAFFVVGLHPASSRWVRRFAWPTLAFNAHAQFERLREQGRFVGMQRAIRSRDHALQGSINPSLSTFGELSEARQYSGRAVEENWTCPFQVYPGI